MRLNATQVRQASPLELAWAVGLFTGEGCVSITRSRNNRTYVHLAISMKDHRSIVRFAKIFGLATYSFKHSNYNYLMWAVSAGGRPAEKILAQMLPGLIGTDKGDQVLRVAETVGVLDWISGKKKGERPREPMQKNRPKRRQRRRSKHPKYGVMVR